MGAVSHFGVESGELLEVWERAQVYEAALIPGSGAR